MKKNSILILMILSCFSAYSQDHIPSLSTKQMKADFECLYQTIKENSPQLTLRKQVEGWDILSKIDSLRNQLDTITQFRSFYYLLIKATLLCNDQHTSFFRLLEDEEGADSMYSSLNRFYENQFKVEITLNNSTMEIAKYHQGNYYIYTPATAVTFSGEAIPVPIGTQIIEIADQAIDDYIVSKKYRLKNSFSWDMQRKKRYDAQLSIPSLTPITLKYQNGKLQRLDLKSFQIMANYSFTVHTPLVAYLEADQILFIRIPEMSLKDLPFYKKEIEAKAKNKLIKKIIFDVRENEGGSDHVWTGLIRMIMDAPIPIAYHYLSRYTPLIHKAMLKKFTPLEVDTIPIPLLQNEHYWDYGLRKSSLIPDENSLDYQGKIYILHDEQTYSSAANLVTIANECPERFVTIGEHSGKLMGRGIDPMMFILPHSKITFRMETMLDYHHVSTITDFYHDQSMYPMDLTPEEYYDCHVTEEGRYSIEFLRTKDPMYKKVLELP